MNRTLACLCVGLLLVAPSGLAAEGEKPSPPVAAAEAVKVSLTSPAVAGTLKDALEQVSKLGKVRIVVDWESIHDTGVKDDVRVAVKAPKATVGQLLELALTQAAAKGHPLAYYTEDDAVIVTTQRRVLLRNRVPAASARADARAPARIGALPKVDFQAVPAKDVFRFLQAVSGANMHVNWKALELSGVTKETPVSLNVSNVSIGRALTLVTEQLSAGKDKYESIYWIADADMVRISTGTALNRKLYIRVVDVASLLFIVPDFPGPRISFDTMGKNQTDSTSSSEGGFWKDEEDWDDDEDKDDRRSARERVEQTLIDIVKDSIGPDMWQPQGQGSIRLLHRKLVISQTDLGFKLMEQATRRR